MSVVTFINGVGVGFVLGAALEVGYAYIPHFQKIILALTVVLTAGVLAFGNFGGEVASSSWHLLGVVVGSAFGTEAVKAALRS